MAFILTDGTVYWCVALDGRLVPASSPSFYVQEGSYIKNINTRKYVTSAGDGYLVENDFNPTYADYFQFEIGNDRVDWVPGAKYNVSKIITLQGYDANPPGLWMKVDYDQYLRSVN
jgi:hypothetical protein